MSRHLTDDEVCRYVDDSLGKFETLLVAKHISECDECSRAVDVYSALLDSSDDPGYIQPSNDELRAFFQAK